MLVNARALLETETLRSGLNPEQKFINVRREKLHFALVFVCFRELGSNICGNNLL